MKYYIKNEEVAVYKAYLEKSKELSNVNENDSAKVAEVEAQLKALRPTVAHIQLHFTAPNSTDYTSFEA